MRYALITLLSWTLLAAGIAAAQQTPRESLPEPAVAPPPHQPIGPAAGDVQQDITLTIYSSADPGGFDPQRFIAQQQNGRQPHVVWQVPGFAVVKQRRTVDLPAGVGTLNFTDVAQFIDPTTVSFKDLANPQATQVLEQQFKFDLVSPSKLLERYIDRTITVNVQRGDDVDRVTGILLSATQGQLTLQTDAGIQIVSSNDIQLPELPGGLITRPTLTWLLSSQQAGPRQVETTYQTDGITWKADYNLLLNEDDTQADLVAWVTLVNLSGVSYPDARLKLIAGDVQRIQPAQPMVRQRLGSDMVAMEAAGFEQQAFFEYHLYTLPRPTTVAQNTTQQITLFPTVRQAGVEKVLVYYGLPQAARWGFFPEPRVDRNFGGNGQSKVDVYIRLQNTEENQMGMPLPRGKIRVFKQDPSDGGLEFVGEDLIDHTPRNEEVLIRLGQSFDLVGERTQADFQVDARRRVIEETFRIQIRNQKQDQAERVIIKENLYRWSNWEITEHSHDFEKIDSRTIHFDVLVPPEGEQTVTYTVRYTW